MSVLTRVASFRVSFQLRLTEPSAGSTASHWLKWSARPVSSLTMRGALQVWPPSADRATNTLTPPLNVPSIQEQYRVPRFGPVLASAPQAGYRSARRVFIAGMPMSNATWVGAIRCVGPNVSPPSAELLSDSRLF